jgi:hypothetical protein
METTGGLLGRPVGGTGGGGEKRGRWGRWAGRGGPGGEERGKEGGRGGGRGGREVQAVERVAARRPSGDPLEGGRKEGREEGRKGGRKGGREGGRAGVRGRRGHGSSPIKSPTGQKRAPEIHSAPALPKKHGAHPRTLAAVSRLLDVDQVLAPVAAVGAVIVAGPHHVLAAGETLAGVPRETVLSPPS